MIDLLKELEHKGIQLPENLKALLTGCKKLTVFNTSQELADVATGKKEKIKYEVSYDIPGKGTYHEVTVHRVKNGISANYTEAYMRRRDPGTMVIADDLPSDKERFKDKYGYEFTSLQEETFEWLKEQELSVFFYFAGRVGIGSLGIALAPSNAAFFAMGLVHAPGNYSGAQTEGGCKTRVFHPGGSGIQAYPFPGKAGGCSQPYFSNA